MAIIQTVLKTEIDPRQPVPEILTIIRAITPFHPGQEEAILVGVMEAIEKRLIYMNKGVERDAKSPDESGRNEAYHGELGRPE